VIISKKQERLIGIRQILVQQIVMALLFYLVVFASTGVDSTAKVRLLPFGLRRGTTVVMPGADIWIKVIHHLTVPMIIRFTVIL